MIRDTPEGSRNPRILIVTPEIAYFPEGMGSLVASLSAKAGGLADVSAALIKALFEEGADVHAAIPDYRALFNRHLPPSLQRDVRNIQRHIPNDRVHLAADRAFFYLPAVYTGDGWKKIKVSLAFQREVINNIIPRIQPDLIHCNDWVTGLIPAAARGMGIPSLFTLHNIHTVHCPLAAMEDRGIDTASFWDGLYFKYAPGSYAEIRHTNPVDLITSGVFAAHFVNTVSPSFLLEAAQGRHPFVPAGLQRELANKIAAGCAAGILNAPDASFDPRTDASLHRRYDADNPLPAKQANKQHVQQKLGLDENPGAPLFFWPSRLDPAQKGCQLLAEVLYAVVSRHWQRGLQVVFVADGNFRDVFGNITDFHSLHRRVAVCGFDEDLARLAYGAADFVLMPSLYEPCGLPQMIGPLYGTLPVARKTGGIQDTVQHLAEDGRTGNGFLFETYDSGGLLWAMDQAVRFHELPDAERAERIGRVMTDSRRRFNHTVTARNYIALYEKMLQRPLVHAA